MRFQGEKSAQQALQRGAGAQRERGSFGGLMNFQEKVYDLWEELQKLRNENATLKARIKILEKKCGAT